MIGNVTRSSSFNSTIAYASSKGRKVFTTIPVRDVAGEMEDKAAGGRTKKPCYHLSLSLGPDDRHIDDFEWVSATRMTLEQMGWDDRDFAVYLHEDTQFPDSDKVRPHAHIVLNLVGDDGKTADTSWDYYRIPKALREVERELGLTPVPNPWETDRRRDTRGQVMRQQRERREYEGGDRDEPPTPSVRSQIQEAIDDAREGGSIESMFDALHESGITARTTDRGWWLEKDAVRFGGYQLGRGYTLARVRDRQPETERPKPDAKREQQRRVEQVAPIVAKAMNVSGTQELKGDWHVAKYNSNERRLTVTSRRSGDKIIDATADENGQWHDEDSNLTREKVAYFEKNVKPQLSSRSNSKGKNQHSKASKGVER